MIRSVKEAAKKISKILVIPALALVGPVPILGIIGTASLIVSAPTITLAQEESRAISRGREIFRDKAMCHWCHGWDGRGSENDMGFGPSLRESWLDLEGAIEVITCGRIGKEMPAHDPKAYDDGRCYGITKADLTEKEIPTPGLAPLRASEIESVAAFLVEWVFQKLPFEGEFALDYCIRYYNETAVMCDEFR